MNMDHVDARALLHDLVDGELGPERDRAVRGHLEGCDECAAEMEFLLELRASARELPGEIAPPRDLWSDIAARLEPRNAAVAEPQVIGISRGGRTERPRWQQWGALAAAAVVVMAVSSAMTVKLMQDPAVSPVATDTGPGVVAPAPSSEPQRPVTALAAFEPTEQEYLATLAELERAFQEHRGSLSPQTVAVVEENLRIIDRAIEEIRTALIADTGSVELPLLLSGVYRSKVDLLESTVRLYSRT